MHAARADRASVTERRLGGEMSEAATRALVSLCQDIHGRGWVANHDGNASARLADGRFLASPTAVSKRDVRSETLVAVDAEGQVVAGSRKVFSEISLHLAAYRVRPDAAWVLHAHPPYATAWAVSGESFWDAPFLAEGVVSLGERVPVVPYALPGSSTGALESALSTCDAVLLANHGVLVIGTDAEQAFLRMELVEHLARIAVLARALGGPRPLPGEDIAKLLAARKKAGLGPNSSARSTELPASGASVGSAPDVAALVREALSRLG